MTELVLNPVDCAEVQASCSRAQGFLRAAHSSASRLLAVATEEDHPLHREDLFRSMLIFSCAGMDRTCKAIVEDAFQELSKMDSAVEEQLVRFTRRFLSPNHSISPGALAKVLLSPWTPRQVLVEAFVDELTSDSMQSVEQLHRVFAAVRISDDYLRDQKQTLAAAFRSRNQIVHEMDLAPSQSGTPVQRTSRPEAVYVAQANAVIGAADHLIRGTSDQIYLTAAADPFWSSQPEYIRPSAPGSEPTG